MAGQTHPTSRIGLYGGSFDPIHFGHLNLAMQLMESNQLDEVWFLPARHSPHKPSVGGCAAHHRLKMVEIAIAPIPQFFARSYELHRSGPSYTIDTVEELLAARPALGLSNAQFYLLLGADAICHFPSWHRVLDLVRTIPLLIGERDGDEKGELLFPDSFSDNPEVLEITAAILRGKQKGRRLDISSSEIRARINQGMRCEYLLPEKVLDYIHANRLYYPL